IKVDLNGEVVKGTPIPGHPWDVQCACITSLTNGAWIVVQNSVPPPDFGMATGVYPVMNLTVERYEGGPMNLTFDFILDNPYDNSDIYDAGGNSYPNQVWEDGQFTYMETFEKDLVLGWNLISLPLTPVNSSTSAVLGNGTFGYNVVYRYNATTNQFECPSTMDPGIGYFVNVTTAGTWNYTGAPYTSMTIDLKQGLNCIGWTNTSENLPDAMSSISGNYRYVAGWDADNSEYEVYDANAPAGVPEFIDFTTMARGNGYWIAAKEDCTLNV
ncbi:MAG: hypothetical protein U9Q37_10660, partial [Euryarchaeota archaeon]|nr:hypothetical protein [Euryarchaeota archaeon]